MVGIVVDLYDLISPDQELIRAGLRAGVHAGRWLVEATPRDTIDVFHPEHLVNAAGIADNFAPFFQLNSLPASNCTLAWRFCGDDAVVRPKIVGL